jgi:rRNA maturation RNase YbeY
MINLNYETDFILNNESLYIKWLSEVILSENKTEGEINYIFCDDSYLLKLNQKHLQHDTLTDIISFDYSERNELSGDIFISVERVMDNANEYKISFEEEIKRVMVHGVLHYCGYKDKTDDDAVVMRNKENEKINMFHVKQN